MNNSNNSTGNNKTGNSVNSNTNNRPINRQMPFRSPMNNMGSMSKSTSHQLDPLQKRRPNASLSDDMNQTMPSSNSQELTDKNNLPDKQSGFDKKEGLNKAPVQNSEAPSVVGEGMPEVSAELPDQLDDIGNAQPNRRSHFNNGLNTNNVAQNAINKFNKNNRPKPKKSEEGKEGATKAVASNKETNPKTNNTKKSTATSAAKKAASKTGVGKALNTAAKLGAAKNALNSVSDAAEDTAGKVEEVAKEKARLLIRKKVVAALMKILLPILPYIGIFLITVLFIFVVLFVVISWFNDEERFMDEIEVNYCTNVNLKWKEWDEVAQEEVEKEADITSDEYIAYLMTMSGLISVKGENTINALSVIFRTNFYATAGNMDSDTCYYELDTPYEGYSEAAKSAVDFTNNKIFSFSPLELGELVVDDKFSYTREDSFDSGVEAYVLYEDGFKYPKDYINEITEEEQRFFGNPDLGKRTFSVYGSSYLDVEKKYTWQGLLYHFYAPDATTTLIRNVKKKPLWGSDDYYNGGEYGDCSDISLSTTPLTREQFIAAVEAHVNNSDFKNNAGKIYDVAIANHFNPELIIIRAKLEGNFSEQGGRYNYFGIACFNGNKSCTSFKSMDEAVLRYISIVKGYNVPTLFEVMKKYAYLGDYWFNPGGSGLGGCYYYTYLLKYMSAERQKAVTAACTANTTCSKGGVGVCVATTQEDRDAYSKYQVERMTQERQRIFGIGADQCVNEGNEGNTEGTGDPNSLGARVARYAVATFDSWRYSQTNRNQQGFVDCSSMVKRAYEHFGVAIFDRGNYTSSGEYEWCQNHSALVSGSSLQAGDLIFYSGKNGIHHVAMYIGNGQSFAAHGEWINEKKGIRRPVEDQVSVKPYNGGGSYFCRPSLTVK